LLFFINRGLTSLLGIDRRTVESKKVVKGRTVQAFRSARREKEKEKEKVETGTESSLVPRQVKTPATPVRRRGLSSQVIMEEDSDY
jgi:hypothetical protein